MRKVISTLGVALLVGGLLILWSDLAIGGIVPGDFLTGGGFIWTTGGGAIGTHPVAKGNFGVGGGVKRGDWWGHLNYIDHGNGLHVKGTDVTAYVITPGTTDTDTDTKQPHGSRDICGTARTNHPLFPEVFYRVTAADKSEPGVDDIFIIRLYGGPFATVLVYTTEPNTDPMDDNTLGGTGPGGGNINLHAHNPSNIVPTEPPACAGP